MEIDMLPIRFCMERPLDPKNSGGKINFPYTVTDAKCEINRWFSSAIGWKWQPCKVKILSFDFYFGISNVRVSIIYSIVSLSVKLYLQNGAVIAVIIW